MIIRDRVAARVKPVLLSSADEEDGESGRLVTI